LLGTIVPVNKLAYQIFIFIFSLNTVFAEVRLSEIWPESMAKGQFDELQLRYTVSNRLVLLTNSPWCLIDGQLLRLKKAPRRIGMDWWVGEELIDRLGLKRYNTYESKAITQAWMPPPVIVIDPGHGGKDPGAIGLGGSMEKDIVLDISKRVMALLKKRNLVVQSTRDKDVFVDLHERGEMSNRWRASVFVSIHANSHGSRDMEGYQLYRQNTEVSAASRSEYVRIRFPLPQFTPTPVAGKPQNFSNHVELFNWKDRESQSLSEDLHQHLQYRQSPVNTQPQKNLCVLRETMAPAILVEVDFVSNPEVEYKMGTSAWREKMAQDIVNGILSYLGMGPQS
jgi:N-acetylmuramoyl-L-alanine amidase